MAIELTTPPASEPVTLAEAKEHCRVFGSDDDAYLTALIVVARQMAETYTELSFIAQSLTIYLDKFQCGEFRIHVAPVLSVSSIKYFDEDNAEQTLDPSAYYVDTKSKPARLAPVDTWPATYSRPNAVSIEVSAGYGAAAANVPQVIRQAILLTVGELFENREESVIGTVVSALPLTAERLLRPFKLLG